VSSDFQDKSDLEIQQEMASYPPSLAYRQVIRIAKRDSAWVYHVMEAQEGIVAYSTLPEDRVAGSEPSRLSPAGESTCDLELTIPAGFLTQWQELLEHFRQGGVWIEELDRPKPEGTGN
jgi:hypothetical protein